MLSRSAAIRGDVSGDDPTSSAARIRSTMGYAPLVPGERVPEVRSQMLDARCSILDG
jgi:hypothetical protein